MSLDALDNWVLWAILLLGLGSYQSLCYWILSARAGEPLDEAGPWIDSLQILISALPLLGLLGTITGLLDTFFAMSLGQNLDQSQLLSSGIADALITTQFGLAMAVPAWLLHAYLRHLYTTNKAPSEPNIQQASSVIEIEKLLDKTHQTTKLSSGALNAA